MFKEQKEPSRFRYLILTKYVFTFFIVITVIRITLLKVHINKNQ